MFLTRPFLILPLALSFTLISACVQAAPYEATTAPTVGDLAQLQGQTILLQAELKKQQAQNELSKLRLAQIDSDSMPALATIIGNGKNLTATFVLANGTKTQVAIGSALPNGYLLKSIDPNRNLALLIKNGQRFEVGMSSAQSALTNTGGSYVPAIQ